MNFQPRIRDYMLVASAAVLVIVPVIIYGVPNASADLLHHLQISRAFYDCWLQGTFLPNWVINENAGYGAVTVRFYPPLMHASLAFSRLVFGTWNFAVFAVFSAWSIIGCVGIYLFARDLGIDGLRSAASAVLFGLAPYHLNQFYNSAMYGEFAALSLLPFCFLFAGRVCDRSGIANVIGLAVSFALLVLSNLPQTVVGAVGVGIFIVLKLDRETLRSQLLRLSAAGVLALTASSFYWLRVVREMSWINISLPNTDPLYDYRNHFLLTSLQFDDSGVWFASLFFLLIIVVLAIAVAASGTARTMWHGKLRPVSILMFFSVVMMLPLSKFIWDNIEILQKVQFPWRFLSVAAIASSLLLGNCLGFLTIENFRKQRPFVLLIVGAIAIAATFSIKQVALGAVFIEPQLFDRMVSNSGPKKGLWHWHPIWFEDRAMKQTTKVVAGSRDVTITGWETETREFSVASGDTVDARIALLYYPHWTASINGRRAEVLPVPDGAVLIPLPAEEAHVRLMFDEPVSTLIARQVSVWTWIGMVIALLLGKTIGRRELK